MQELEKWLKDGYSMCDIAKMTQKSLSTIRYWCKKYNLKSQYNSFLTLENGKRKKIQKKTNASSINAINWVEIQEFYNQRGTYRSIKDKFGIDFVKISQAVKLGLLKTRSNQEGIRLSFKNSTRKPFKHSEETKRAMSIRQKQFLKDNPDKHPWRHHDKFKSQPCENFKGFLKELNVNFLEEFDPQIDGRNFSIDIALPDKMIAIEINGIHHYDKEGNLKPYYQKRHDLITAKGWKIYEIFCRACFNKEKVQEFLDIAVNSPTVQSFDYFNYCPQPKKPHLDTCPNCAEQKWHVSKLCIKCSGLSKRKVDRPTKEQLELLVKTKPILEIAKMYQVSDNAIRKWCKLYQIDCKKRKK